MTTGEPALVSIDALVEARLDQVVLRGVREQERVEGRQQPWPAIDFRVGEDIAVPAQDEACSPSTSRFDEPASRSKTGFVTLVFSPAHFEKSRASPGRTPSETLRQLDPASPGLRLSGRQPLIHAHERGWRRAAGRSRSSPRQSPGAWRSRHI
jgi:hypothetical protein